MGRCEEARECRRIAWPNTWQAVLKRPCLREIEGTVDACPNLRKLECGHSRLYLMWTHDRHGNLDNPYCARCRELAEEVRDAAK